MSKNALILGATSDMALAIARKFGSHGYTLTLAGRNLEKLKIIKADIEIRQHATVDVAVFDAANVSSHQSFYDQLPVKPDIVFCVFGLLGDQMKAQYDWKTCEEILVSNYVGAVSILNIIANDMETKKEGTIVGISSVAGERGRQSNYLYGSAKAGFTAYLSGLRNRLCKHGVHVLTVKPGFVKTKMLDGMKTPGPLTAQPKDVAEDIYNAVQTKKNTIYTRGVWRLVMYTIKSIPEPIFKKLKL